MKFWVIGINEQTAIESPYRYPTERRAKEVLSQYPDISRKQLHVYEVVVTKKV